MHYIGAALVAVAIGVLLKGLFKLAFVEWVIILAVPEVLLYKLLGNRPPAFGIAGMLAGVLGCLVALWAYVVVPTQYYYELWGWLGIAGGIVAALLFPTQLIMFAAVAYFNGGAAAYFGNFFAELAFALAGMLLFYSAYSMPIWKYFWRKWRKGSG
ncbi:MAG: hypothetical protein ACREUA_01545 [Burkholderiales bacterium]